MSEDPKMVSVSKEVLDKVLIQYPNHAEFCDVTSASMKVTVYRLRDTKRIIGVLGVDSTTGKVIECKVSEGFL